jgi:hypothetical protein
VVEEEVTQGVPLLMAQVVERAEAMDLVEEEVVVVVVLLLLAVLAVLQAVQV